MNTKPLTNRSRILILLGIAGLSFYIVSETSAINQNLKEYQEIQILQDPSIIEI